MIRRHYSVAYSPKKTVNPGVVVSPTDHQAIQFFKAKIDIGR